VRCRCRLHPGRVTSVRRAESLERNSRRRRTDRARPRMTARVPAPVVKPSSSPAIGA
jgi:hypothetical protein